MQHSLLPCSYRRANTLLLGVVHAGSAHGEAIVRHACRRYGANRVMLRYMFMMFMLDHKWNMHELLASAKIVL